LEAEISLSYETCRQARAIVDAVSPDNVKKVSEVEGLKIQQVLVGSCTNSSYEDITRAASVARQALQKGLKAASAFIITPGSEQVRYTIERDGILKLFEQIGGTILANACGPCIGMGQAPPTEGISVRSFNRNFLGRSGTKDAQVYLAGPEVCAAAQSYPPTV
jgi:aconitate hydratase